MEELARTTRNAPPAHFMVKIKSFSSLSASSLHRFESCNFRVDDYEWKLAIYPNGDKEGGGENHISIYLVLADNSNLSLKKEIRVTFRLSVFDHIQEKYMMMKRVSRFNALKSESGFSKFLPLEVFKDSTKGYLVKDTCIFGAEVFYRQQHTNKGQCLTMLLTKPEPFKYSWEVKNFSSLEDKKYYSEKFSSGSHDFRLLLFPQGNGDGKEGNNISLYLMLAADIETRYWPPEKQVMVEFKLRLLDQLNQNHMEKSTAVSLSSSTTDWGFTNFLCISRLMDKSNGYLVNDSCIFEAEVTVLGSAKSWD